MGAAPAPRRVPFVGLTGGMGAGKSEALRALERLGAATLSTDAVVHELLAGDDEVRRLLVERFGAGVAPDGAVDRAALARRVFGDDEARAWLEGVLWPRVGARVAAWREQQAARADAPRAAVVEVPLLFEAGMDAIFDATIAVVADDEVRARRLAERSHEGSAGREGRQLPQSEKAERADFAVDNSGSIGQLEDALSRVLAKLGS